VKHLIILLQTGTQHVVKPNEGQESWIYKYQCKQNVITLSSDFWQVGGFLQILRFLHK